MTTCLSVSLQVSMSPGPVVLLTRVIKVCPVWTVFSILVTAVDRVPRGPVGTGRTVRTWMRYRHNNRHIACLSHSEPQTLTPLPPQCELQPCFSPGACVNSPGGFSCRSCPPGLWGAPLVGTGLDYAKTHRQVRDAQIGQTHRQVIDKQTG